MPEAIVTTGKADADASGTRRGQLAHLIWPVCAPFLILTCAPRWELAAVAACWSILLVPGVLALVLWFPVDHPLRRWPAIPAVASVLGLFVFGVVAWAGCLLHTTLTTVLIGYGLLYAACVAALAWLLFVRSPLPAEAAWPTMDLPLAASRRVAVVVLLGVALLLAGVALATVQTRNPFRTPDFFGARPYWWYGTLLGAAGALLAAPVLWWGWRVRPDSVGSHPPGSPGGSRGRQGSAKGENPANRGQPRPRGTVAGADGAWLVVFLWAAVAGLTWHTMHVAYALPAPDFPSFHRPPWNTDDITYVAQALDERYGLPLGRYEPSIGSDRALNRADIMVLVAPLMAAVSRATGVECAALQHSVMRPLIVLTGVSALAALLMVVFRGHRWAVPLGLLAVLMLICKSWEYERSMTEFTVWRAMQTKSIHLWLLHPLQLASLLVLARRPNLAHVGFGLVVAVVSHLVHPFATILGAGWAAVFAAGMLVGHRRALPHALLILACYGALGAEYRFMSRAMVDQRALSSGWSANDPEQSRDLARADDQPLPRHDPRILFGWNVEFCLGALALPLVLVLGQRHRELLLSGVVGVVTVACCNSTLLGRLVNVALPTELLWRFRWVLPSLLHVAVVTFVLYWGFAVLLRGRDGVLTATRAFLAALAAALVFAGGLAIASGYLMRAGPQPTRLTKFSNDMHGLVDLLGGVRAAAFVWGPSSIERGRPTLAEVEAAPSLWSTTERQREVVPAVTRELPQLMPNLKLVLSRESIMLPAEDPKFREFVLQARDLFHAPLGGRPAPPDTALAKALQKLVQLYPIDFFIVEYKSGRGEQDARVLQQAGWQRVGRSGIYEVWRRAVPTSAGVQP